MEALKGKYGVSDLCSYLECSRSGYYGWINRGKPQHNCLDLFKTAAILELYGERKTRGRRQIQMHLERRYNLHMSLGSVHRYMTALNIQSTRKKKYPPRKVSELPEFPAFPNVLEQRFLPAPNREIWLTDITYINCRNGRLYLSAIKNMRDKSILAYAVSEKNDVDLVMRTLEGLGTNGMQQYVLHSDQGSQYVSRAYRALLVEKGIVGSMSRKGVPYDNSPMESFFSILKNEELKLYKRQVKDTMRETLAKFIHYYNYERPQIGLKKMTPMEYRDHF